MVATHLTLAGLMALSIAAATPVQVASEARSFKLPLTRRASKVTDDQSLTNVYASMDWTTVVSFGGQNFTMLVDTGSSDIWVLSTEMAPNDRKAFPSNHFYDCSKSKNCKMMDGSTFNISYISGTYGSGKVATDDVSINTASVNMPFGLGTSMSATGMLDSFYDGMLGLAFGAHNTQSPKQGPTFMEAIQSELDEPVFTMNLPLTGSGQTMEFGHVDKNLYNGTLKEVKIDNGTASVPLGWAASVSFSVGGKNISTQLTQVLFDTGGVDAHISDTAAAAYWTTVPGAQDLSHDGTGWVFPCDAHLPDLSYDFVGVDGKVVSAVVPGKFMNGTSLAANSQTLCMGSLKGMAGAAVGNVGYGFFHSYFTVFDQSKPSVSFAPYPQQELDGQALVISSSGAASASTLTGTATATSGGQTKPTGNQSAGKNGTFSSGSPSTVTSAVAVAVTAVPTAANDAAPGGSNNAASSGTAKSSASELTIPSFAMAIFAAAIGLMTL